MRELSTGTITFLFTDVEGSTSLWENYPDEMRSVLAMHDSIVREAITTHHGHVIKTMGDGFNAVFDRAIDAIRATIEIQRALATARFFEDPEVVFSVRMGLHTGEAELRSSDYYGQAPNRAARIMSVASGGQILLSAITAEVIREHLPPDLTLQDAGEHLLKGLIRPEHLYQLTAPDLKRDFPPIKSLASFPNNLPIQLTSFIGREKEREDVKNLLQSARLVTLTGSGGTGKSRLSVEIGKEEVTSFTHGVWLIELAPLTDPAQIIPAMAQVFGLQEHPFGPLPILLMDYLRDKKLLLILDNCEHIIEDCARLADDLLRHCVGLKILASSREALGIAGEVTYHIPSLADAESTQLFVERARASHPNFQVTASNASAVAQICRRLDGIPLAIELAAARVKLLSPEQIAARLDDRFRLLVGGSRTALPRQQTLRALIDWSYDLLAEEEKRLFRTASVFVGGWTLEALEAVADDVNVFEHLEPLVNKSMVVAEERRNEMRYFLLETIRQYAREKLFEAKQSSSARDRHFTYYDRLAGSIWSIFRTENYLAWRDQADDETENLRAAVEWGLENDAEKAIHLAANFCLMAGWMGSRLEEGLKLCRLAVERVRSLPPVTGMENVERQKGLAKALFVLGLAGMSSGHMPIVIRDLQEAVATARAAGDKLILGYSLEMLFIAAAFFNVPGKEEAVEEGFKIFTEEITDNWGLSMAYQNKARIASNEGNNTEKEIYFAKFKELIQQAPLSIQAGLFYLGLGMNERILGNYETAKEHFKEGLNIFKQIRSLNFELVMKSELAHVARQTGKLADAKNAYGETLRGWQNMGHRGAIANQLECLAFIASIEEEPQRAAKLLGAAEALRERVQSPMTDYERVEYGQHTGRLRAILSDSEFRSCWVEGRSMTMEQAIELALNP